MEETKKQDAKAEGWNPSVTTGEEALIDEERSLDIEGLGQFAPGGYYNQQSVNKPRPTIGKWDDEITPPGRH